MRKRFISLALAALLTASVVGCGASDETIEKVQDSDNITESADTGREDAAEEENDTAGTGEGGKEAAASDVTATLRMYGPGLFTEVGPDGTTDIVSGLKRPGYNELIARFNELYPNVTVEIEAIPWDNWKAAVQTAAMSDDYDIIIHGNANADFCLDLTEYIESDPEVKDNVTFYPFRRNPDNFTEVRAYGISYSLNPLVCVIDKQIFENYGVDLPDSSWTYDDILEIAPKLTGTDPVTGRETYGVTMCPASNMFKNFKVIGLGKNDVMFDFAETLKDTKVSINNEKTVEVFEYMKELSAYSHPDYLEGLELANAWTENNEIAITWVDGAFNIFNTIKANGLTDRFMFLPLPQITEGEDAGRTSSVLQDLNMAIYKNTEQKDLAWAFMKFMLTDEAAQDWLVRTNSIPANKQYMTLMSDVMSDDYAAAIAEIIESNPYMFDSSASVYYDSTWFGTLQADIVTAGDLVIRGNDTPEGVARMLQENVDTYINSLN